jgi:glyoxylase-like metal-dependent hydrolase (beta-lactamase superfamily II)
MKRITPFCVVVLLLAPALVIDAHEIRPPVSLEDLSLTKIDEGIYVVQGLQAMPDKNNKGFISNTGIVLTDAGVVIVDSGGSLQVGKLIVAKVQELSDQPVIAVFNTHVHGDHWLGNAAIREAFPDVRIYAHERAIERLENGEAEYWLDVLTRMTEGAVAGTALVLPDRGLKGGETLQIAGTAFKTHHTGHAHTDSDVMIEVPQDRLLFAGDIIVHGLAVSSGVPRDFNAKGQIEAIRYALNLPVDTFVPGHGPTGGREIPEAALRFLEVLYDSVKRYYAAGMQDYEMRDLVAEDLSEFSDWFAFDEIGRLTGFVYQQVEGADFQ